MGLIIPGGASQVPQEIQDRLKEIDPRMYLQPKQRVVWDSGAEEDRSHKTWVWYVVLKWPEGDPRWRMVQYGQIDPDNAFDLLGEIPLDCPLDQVPGYLKKQLKVANGVPAHICNEISKWNEDQSIRNGAATTEFAQELFEANKSTLFREMGKENPRPVYQHNPPQKASRKKEAD